MTACEFHTHSRRFPSLGGLCCGNELLFTYTHRIVLILNLTFCAYLVHQALLLADLPAREKVSTIGLMLSANGFPVQALAVATVAFAGSRAMMRGGHCA